MLKCQKYIKQVSSDDPIWDNVMKFAADHLVSMNIVEFCYRCSKTVTSDRLLNFSRGLLNRRARPRSPTSDIRLEFIRASIEGLNENEIVINDRTILKTIENEAFKIARCLIDDNLQELEYTKKEINSFYKEVGIKEKI